MIPSVVHFDRILCIDTIRVYLSNGKRVWLTDEFYEDEAFEVRAVDSYCVRVGN